MEEVEEGGKDKPMWQARIAAMFSSLCSSNRSGIGRWRSGTLAGIGGWLGNKGGRKWNSAAGIANAKDSL